MGTLACILKDMGYSISGSDQNVYPPMSDFLADKGIRLFEGYDPANLDHAPDLVIIGNAVTRQNVEARAVLKTGIPYISMPQAVNQFVAKDKKIILMCRRGQRSYQAAIILNQGGFKEVYIVGGGAQASLL